MNNVYEVEEIVSKKKDKGKLKYQVKWVGYDSNQNTWEPAGNLKEVKYMINQFEEKLKNKKTSVGSSESSSSSSTGMESSRKESSILSVEAVEKKKLKPKKLKQKNKKEEEDKKKAAPALKAKMTKKRLADYKEMGLEPPPQAKKLKNDEEKITKDEKVEVKGKGGSTKNQNYSNANGEETKVEVTRTPKKNDVSQEASFEMDSPRAITSAKLLGVDVVCTVEWKPRANGFVPLATTFTNRDLRDRCPFLLLDFYEARLRFPQKSFTTPASNQN